MSLVLLQLLLLLMLTMALSITLSHIGDDDVVGAGLDVTTTTAGTAGVASTEIAFATMAVTLLKVAVAENEYSG